jgi:trk system potassium uptake protein TrkA
MFDYIQLSPEYSISEIETPESWVGKTISQVNVRSNYNINVLAYKESGKIYPLSNPNYLFKENTHLVVSGAWKDVEKLSK